MDKELSQLDNKEKLKTIKKLLKDITKGADPETLKKEYGEFLAKTTPLEIALLEQQLVAEGFIIEREYRDNETYRSFKLVLKYGAIN